jgi:hypothetical protein
VNLSSSHRNILLLGRCAGTATSEIKFPIKKLLVFKFSEKKNFSKFTGTGTVENLIIFPQLSLPYRIIYQIKYWEFHDHIHNFHNYILSFTTSNLGSSRHHSIYRPYVAPTYRRDAIFAKTEAIWSRILAFVFFLVLHCYNRRNKSQYFHHGIHGYSSFQ